MNINLIDKLPYYVVIFSSKKVSKISDDYYRSNDKLVEEAQKCEGFLGIQSVDGITLSYWQSMEAIKKWKSQIEHQAAQEKGRVAWYDWYNIKIAKVESEYVWNKEL